MVTTPVRFVFALFLHKSPLRFGSAVAYGSLFSNLSNYIPIYMDKKSKEL